MLKGRKKKEKGKERKEKGRERKKKRKEKRKEEGKEKKEMAKEQAQLNSLSIMQCNFIFHSSFHVICVPKCFTILNNTRL